MAREPIDIRKSMRVRIALATFLVTLVLLFSPIFYFASGPDPVSIYTLFAITGFALLAIIGCISPLVDRAFPKERKPE